MRAFNQALLAKQAWRLLMNLESLVARLFSAKYYSMGRLVDTVFTGNASAVWRGIEHGLELIKKGMIWRVGNGKMIKVWWDPWIPRGPSLRPISAKGRRRLNKVSDFIQENGNWDINLLNNFFILAE
jgi:hypothetical protein